MVNPVTLDKNDMIFALPALSIYIRIFYNIANNTYSLCIL